MNLIFDYIINKNQVDDCIVNVASHVRDKWIYEKAQDTADGSRVLDAGAGQCPYKKFFSHCNYKTQDFVQYKGSEDETWEYGKIDYVSDITEIPVPNNSFDLILCTEVLEHIPTPIEALKELARILDYGGKILITAPLASGIHQKPFFFYGGFSPEFYKKFLSENGLIITEIKPICGLMKHVAQEIYRAGYVIDSSLKKNKSSFLKYLLMCLLPKILSKLENDIFVEEFTIGYLVEATKKRI